MEFHVPDDVPSTTRNVKPLKFGHPPVIATLSRASSSEQDDSTPTSPLSKDSNGETHSYVIDQAAASTPSDIILTFGPDSGSDSWSLDRTSTPEKGGVNEFEFGVPSTLIIPPVEEHTPIDLLPTVKPKVDQGPPQKNEPAEDDSRAHATIVEPASEPAQLEPVRSHYTSDPIQSHSGDNVRPIQFPTTQLPLKVRLVDADESLQKRGKRKLKAQKHLMQAFQICINGFPIFATWYWPRYYYVFLPFITITVALNIVMIFSVTVRAVRNKIVPEKVIMPETSESMVFLIPCYNETKEELTKSLEALARQTKIEDHKHAILIVCDGKVRGHGMEKTTADYLLQDILIEKTERIYIPKAYTAWDQQPMDIVVQRGRYQGVPYYCIVKQQNQGKRDGLIIARSFLYNFNRRLEKPHTIFSPGFFDHLCSFLIQDAAINYCEHLIGMDADTVFADDCIYEMLQESRYPHTMGVCGYVAVDWKNSSFNIWRLYQNAEYCIAQCLRRMHQSMVTHKVSCLPGCCQLLRVTEETCGDHVLLDLFGYCPIPTDGMIKQIRATASEDRNHVCHMLSARPTSQTRQALKARAYTDVPASVSVFLSQRRRWTLGATSNDLLLTFAPGVQWFERILAFVNVLTWLLNPFILASLACFIYACLFVATWIIMAFVSVMLVPIVYYILIPAWFHNNWKERVQFWAGLFFFVICGPFINVAVLFYACFYMDSFGWGKTRKVITEQDSGEKTESELQRLERGEKTSSGSSPTPRSAEV
ncbi:hypothetical protein OPT61_g839 [Boeremia exigua]|uniref:Uncharacterized protein n=1 Tax=Boeremia exigua TaxID=749465 RepID=A0ACC2ISQ1_9PLEO|nr:hypothetical protein OPT61_g839 [Boeremia exigua]